jgi:hypothetical protein
VSWRPWCVVRDLVLRDAGAPWSPAERLVAVVLGDCLDEAGSARPSVALVVSRSALGRRTVQRALVRLCGPGGIFIEAEGGSTPEGGRLASVYTLSTRAMVAPVPAPQGRGSDPRHSGTGATDDTDPRHSGAPRTQEGLISGASHRVAARVVRKRTHGANGASRGNGSSAPWVVAACNDWNARFGPGSAPGGRIAGGLGPVIRANGWEKIRPAWQRYLAETRHPAPSAQDFAAHWVDWRPEGEPDRLPLEPAGPVFCRPRGEQ